MPLPERTSMKFPTRSAAIVAGSVAALALSGVPAQAATPHWDETRSQSYSLPVTLYLCDGDTYRLNPGQITYRDVCGVKMYNDRTLFVYVDQTGTTLIDKDNCSGTTKKVTFTDQTDTSNTAMIYYGGLAGCG